MGDQLLLRPVTCSAVVRPRATRGPCFPHCPADDMSHSSEGAGSCVQKLTHGLDADAFRYNGLLTTVRVFLGQRYSPGCVRQGPTNRMLGLQWRISLMPSIYPHPPPCLRLSAIPAAFREPSTCRCFAIVLGLLPLAFALPLPLDASNFMCSASARGGRAAGLGWAGLRRQPPAVSSF